MTQTPPRSPLPLPEVIRSSHEGWDISLAWSGISPLATWRLERGSEVRFVKLAPRGWEPALREERDRLRWAHGRLPVPLVLDFGTTTDLEWMITEGCAGQSASTLAQTEPDTPSLVRTFARALRAFHATPMDDCPFDSRLDVALALARSRLHRQAIDPSEFHEQFQHLSAEEAVRLLEVERPPTEDLVLCHGDYCYPNLLIDDGRISAYLDLGELGVADRWADIAVGSWSTTWNVGGGWEDVFFDAYGVEPDPERLSYYRLLYDVVGGTFIRPMHQSGSAN